MHVCVWCACQLACVCVCGCVSLVCVCVCVWVCQLGVCVCVWVCQLGVCVCGRAALVSRMSGWRRVRRRGRLPARFVTTRRTSTLGESDRVHGGGDFGNTSVLSHMRLRFGLNQ